MPTLLHFIKQHKTECICYLLFILLAIVGFVFHEPSYDESQAWQIAKTASFADMIWGPIPIYEGHPPFWHLLLAGPAKLGLSFHVTSAILGMTFLLISGFLLFFKSPFPKWIRCCLPFSFFLFYQYGIIVRPYGLMMVLMWLLALCFPTKDKHPARFVILLAALAACHLFGLAIAGGITLAWLWEIKNAQPWKTFLINLRKDIRFQWMLGLLAWVLLIMACITLPRFGAKLHSAAPPVSVIRQIIYVLFAMPAETVLTDFDSSFQTTNQLLPWAGLLSTALVGIVLWALTLYYTPRKHWLYLLLPYACISVILSQYSSCHHVGMILILFVTYFWITPLEISRKPELINKLAKLLLGVCLVLPIAWSLNVLYWDYKLPLYPGKQMVEFLKKYNLTNHTIFIAWPMTPMQEPNYYSFNTNAQADGPLLNVYLKHNILANFHDGKNKTYVENFCPSYEEMVKILNHWRNDLDVPTVLINKVPLHYLYNNPDVLNEYRTAYVAKEYHPWKLGLPKSNPQTIYLFRTLWDKYKDQILADASPAQKRTLENYSATPQ